MLTGLIKNIIILVNMAGILLFNTFLSQDISVRVSAPAAVVAGNTIEVEVKIDKGKLQGFARYQVELPNGVVASPIERAFADFEFRDNTMKLIWLNLPPEEIITIRYQLMINERLKGDLDLSGTFSFIDRNQRQQHVDPSTFLAIEPSPAVDTRLIVDVRDAGQKLTTPLPHLEAGRNVAAIRQTPYMGPNNNIIVNLVISKEGIQKFAKIEETIPEGYTTRKTNLSGGIPSPDSDGTVKFIWTDLPNESVFTVSYELIPTKPGVSTQPLISGVFSYLDNDLTQSVNIVQADIDPLTISRNELLAIAATAPVEAPAVAVTTPVTTQPERQPETRPVAQRPPLAARTQLMNQLEPETGIYYRVQLAAGHRPVNVNRYFKRLNIEDEVRTEMHEGWIKYSIGSYYDYKAARDYRVHVWNTTPVKDAFVAAYNDGKRITVQEALMVSNHRWYR